MCSRQVDFNEIQKGMDCIKKVIEDVASDIKSFDIIDAKLVPEGLKPIARSISWLVEQILIQNIRVRTASFGIEYVEDPPHNLTQYDCIIRFAGEKQDYYVNIKTSLKQTDKKGRFDVSKADKLIALYKKMPDIVLLVAVITVGINGVTVTFENVILFNVAWVPTVYYNRANHNLQSSADGSQLRRNNKDFVSALKTEVKKAGHGKHY